MPRGRQIILVSMTAGWVLLGAVCARYDLAISRILVDSTSGWAKLGERYGTLPGVYVLAGSTVLLYLATEAGKVRSKAKSAMLWALASTCAAMALGVTGSRILSRRFTLVEGVAALAFSAGSLLALRSAVGARLSPSARMTRAALWAAQLGVSSWLCVHVIKLLWGRVRYRDLDALASTFTPWYLPQGMTGHASFPSGHSAMGWMLLPCLMLWPRGSWPSRVAAVCGVAWGAFVASSRVVIGAHYASDVLFSTAFAMALMTYALLLPESAREATSGEAMSPGSPHWVQ